mmetsp:Transcript_16221/g.32449  ORF Transcript_16221/g.32449 Transcript_16221/m.32449 type:complete len:127 (-) Transcript_16221:1776-2156(-)
MSRNSMRLSPKTSLNLLSHELGSTLQNSRKTSKRLFLQPLDLDPINQHIILCMIPITSKTKSQSIRLTPIDLQTEIIIPLPIHEIIRAIPTPSRLPIILLVLHKVQAEFIVGFHTQRQEGEGDSKQ